MSLLSLSADRKAQNEHEEPVLERQDGPRLFDEPTDPGAEQHVAGEVGSSNRRGPSWRSRTGSSCSF